MLRQQTLYLLHAHGLTGMAQALEEQRGVPDVASFAFEDRLTILLEREHCTRGDPRLARLLQLARLRHAACVEDVNFRVKRGLDRALLVRLVGSDWIRQHEVVLLAPHRHRQELVSLCAASCRLSPGPHRALCEPATIARRARACPR
jgi:IstB-like ATP binding protein